MKRMDESTVTSKTMIIYCARLARFTSSFFVVWNPYKCMEKINKHIIAFRENKIIVENPGENEKDPLFLISFLGQLGVALSPKFKGIITPEAEREILDSILPWAVKNFGLGKKWLTVYDNPEYLIAKTPEELLIDQICLYMVPEIIGVIKDRDGEEDFWSINNYEITRVFEPVTVEDFCMISKNLLESRTPLGPERSITLNWFLENPEYLRIPEEVPMKETLCRILDTGEFSVNSPTDILRYLSWVSIKGDLRYPEKFKPTSIPSRSRKIANRLLSDLLKRRTPEFLACEMNRYREAWVGYAKTCHPKEKEIIDLFQLFFRGDKSWKNKGWGNQIRKAYDSHDWERLINLYLQRPGEFIRHFDSLFRRFEEDIEIRNKLFSALLDSRMPTKLLLALSYYYDKRNFIRNIRSYINKQGVRLKIFTELPEMNEELIELIQSVLSSSIAKNYCEHEKLEGKKYILDIRPDTEVVLSDRASNFGIVGNMYGMKVDIPKTGLLRFFIQWIDPDGTQDLDLHAKGLIGNDLIEVGWYAGFNSNDVVLHSGDIRNQKGDCSEYITIDLGKAKQIGLSKLIVTADDYNHHRLGSSCETYIGYSVVSQIRSTSRWSPLKSNTPFRVRLEETNNRSMSLYVINLEEGWMKLITESLNEKSYNFPEDLVTHFIEKTLTFGKLLEINLKARGGQLVTEEDEDTLHITEENYQEWMNELLK